MTTWQGTWSVGSSARDNQPRKREGGLAELTEDLAPRTRCKTKDGPWIAGVEFNGTRSKENVISASILTFDFDGIPVEAWEKLQGTLNGTLAISWPTWRDDPGGPVRHRRLLFPLARPISGGDYARVWLVMAEKLLPTGAVPDKSYKDPSHLFYTLRDINPAVPGQPVPQLDIREGKPLNPDLFLAGKNNHKAQALKPDPNEIRRALSLLIEPGTIFEIRAPQATTAEWRKTHTESGYFDDPDQAIRAVARILAPGVYITLNPLNQALLARANNRLKSAPKVTSADKDVLKRRWLPIDIDPIRPTEISSSDAEHELASDKARDIRSSLSGAGWPEPILADSGNGAHLLYRIDLPADDGGLIERCLKNLSARWSDELAGVDTKVHNPARIWKLYGTIAAKGDSLPERPHRLARILEHPEQMQVVDRALLEQLAGPVAKPTTTETRRATTKPKPKLKPQWSLEEWIAQKIPPGSLQGPEPWNNGRKWIFRQCPFNPEHNRGEAVLTELNGKAGFMCQHNSCSGNNWHSLRALFEPEAERRAQRGKDDIPPPDDDAAGQGSDEPVDWDLVQTKARHKEIAPPPLDEIPPPTDEDAPPPTGGKPPEDPIDEIDDVDVRNSKILARIHGRDIRHCKKMGRWFVWDGTHWGGDSKGEMHFKARDVVRELQRERIEACRELTATQKAKASAQQSKEDKAKEEDNDELKQLKSRVARLSHWVHRAGDLYGLNAMITLAGSEPGIPILSEELDPNEWILPVKNGTIDLRTGKLREHRREDLATRISPVEYRPDATSQLWASFLFRIMDQKKELVDYLARAVGYSLTGSVREQTLFFCHGGGKNGKSTFLGALLAVMGDYGISAAPDILLACQSPRHPTEIADLQGARLVTTIETSKGRAFDEAKLKLLTGGDRLKARFMRQDFFEFDPHHKIWLAANYKPVVKGTDEAIWRRLPLIPFTVSIPPEERDAELLNKLRANELPGILAWAVRGCLEWQRVGLAPPAQVAIASQEYRKSQDQVRNWIDACCTEHPSMHCGSNELYDSYRTWARQQGEETLTQTTWGDRLTDLGYARSKDGRGKIQRNGIGLAAIDVDDEKDHPY